MFGNGSKKMSDKPRHVLIDILLALLLLVCVALVGGMAYLVWQFIL